MTLAMPQSPVGPKLGERQGWVEVGTLGQGGTEMDVEAELRAIRENRGSATLKIASMTDLMGLSTMRTRFLCTARSGFGLLSFAR